MHVPPPTRAQFVAERRLVRPVAPQRPLAVAYHAIRGAGNAQWQQQHDTYLGMPVGCARRAVLRQLLPKVRPRAHRILRELDREHGTVYGRLLSGVLPLRAYLHNHLRLRDSATCEQCDTGADETVEHLLAECPAYAGPRTHLLRELRSLAPSLPPEPGGSDLLEPPQGLGKKKGIEFVCLVCRYALAVRSDLF